MAAIDTAERLMNLALALSSAPAEGRNSGWIEQRVDGYGGRESEAVKKLIMRDVETLRQQGFDIIGNETGYRMEIPDDHCIVRLTADELAAANLATQYCLPTTLQPIATRALTKLSGVVEHVETTDSPLLSRVYDGTDVGGPDFIELTTAMANGTRVTCHYYRDHHEYSEQRYLEPWNIVAYMGQWYLVAFDVDRDEPRVFRISRLGKFRNRAADKATQQRGADPVDYVVKQVTGKSQPITAQVFVSDDTCPELRLMAESSEPDPSGGQRLTITSEYRTLVTTCAGYAPDALVLDPPELISDVTALLQSALDTPAPHCDEPSVTEVDHSVAHPPRSWRQNDTGVQLARLLSLVPYMRDHPGISTEAMAKHFGVSENQIETDLHTLVMCGQPGKQYHQMVQISLDKTNLRVVDDQGLGTPAPLGDSESAVVLLAIETLLSIPHLAQLSTELSLVESVRDKIRQARNTSADVVAASGHAPATSDVLLTISAAKTAGHYLQITYASASSGTTSERTVAPHSMVAAGGHTYLWAGEDGVAKTFRLDRILQATMTDESSPLIDISGHANDPFGFTQSERWGRLAIDNSIRWIIDYEQMWVVSSDEHYIFVDVPYVSQWLESFILGHGGTVIPIEPNELTQAVRRRAQAALVRYGSI